mgnify:FL=1
MRIRLFAIVAAVGLTAVAASSQEMKEPRGYPGFEGKIELDVRDSEADWTPFTPKPAPEGSPNILFVLYDDPGLGAWST